MRTATMYDALYIAAKAPPKAQSSINPASANWLAPCKTSANGRLLSGSSVAMGNPYQFYAFE